VDGLLEQPTFLDARDATETAVGALSATSERRVPRARGIDELYVVFTHFESLAMQTPTVAQVAPVKAAGDPAEGDSDDADESALQAA